MKIAVISLVVLGLLAAVCAAVLVGALSGRSDTPSVSAAADPEVDVLIATRDLPPMSVVDASAVTSKKIAKSQVPPNALLNPVQVVGKVITDRMVAKQPFTGACFAREGNGVYLAAAVPPGMRAMSVQLTDWSGMAGLLYPGSVVDVLVSFKSLGNEGRRDTSEMMATTLLQGLQVLAIGSQSIADDNYRDKEAGALAPRGQINFRMVTLLVDPKQAEILQLAMQNGFISLSMRNPLDGTHEARRLTRAREIAPFRNGIGVTTSSDPAAAPKPEGDTTDAGTTAVDPKLWETLIIRGSASEKKTFPMPDGEAHEGSAEEHLAPAAARESAMQEALPAIATPAAAKG
jgi:pilus assembly protein CpaB